MQTGKDEVVEAAELLAGRLHENQWRKDGEPYFRHCERVADIVDINGGDPNMVAAAYLHDVVEDTDWTVADIRGVFGDDIADLVDELTERRPPGLNRAQRKAEELKRWVGASPRAKTIKLADIIDNGVGFSLLRRTDKALAPFIGVWVLEKLDLLPLLQESSAEPGLYEIAYSIVSNA